MKVLTRLIYDKSKKFIQMKFTTKFDKYLSKKPEF